MRSETPGVHSEIMDQPNNASTAWLHGFADLFQCDRISPMQQQGNVFRRQLLRDGAPNSAAGASNQISLHSYKIGETCSVMSKMLMDATERVPPKKSRRAMFGAA